MLQASLERATFLTKYTSETSSTQQRRKHFVMQWKHSLARTEGTIWDGPVVEDTDTLLFSSSGLIPRFDGINRTRAHLPQLTSREECLRRFQRSFADELAEPFLDKLRRIRHRTDDWDDKGSLQPNPIALHKAHNILRNFFDAIIDSGRVWKTPFLSSDEFGHITMQWNNDNHELHIEISQDTEEYIKIWGSNIEHEMYLRVLKPSEYVALWDWLN